METPANWWHSLEGGRIAQDRPPPPGVGAPYPLIGTTPAGPPKLPSPRERIALTDTLVAQRNASLRRDTENPLPTPGAQAGSASGAQQGSATGVTPAKPAAEPAPATKLVSPASSASAASPADPQRSQLVFAASTPDSTSPAASAPMTPARPSAPRPAAAAKGDTKTAAKPEAADAPEIAMPELQAAPPPEATNAPIPRFAPAPPTIPWIHGITVTHHETPKAPDIPPLSEEGTPVAFDWHADTIQAGETGQIRSIASGWRRGKVLVHGYGDAASAAPAAQVAAVELAWTRARLVANALAADGVPQSAITMAADAFGHDVRIVTNR